ncbi:MAG: hypothetical protein IT269_11335 [Saprospiraceae bacterium]|nr:hypothetical protein [Saprospiraceae bacterium]
MYKLSDYRLVPKYLLVLPQFDDHSGSVLQVSSVNKELSIGTIVKHNSGKALDMFHVMLNGDTSESMEGKQISYKRAASQSIKLYDEEENEVEYKVVHEDDITGWIFQSSITA